MIVYQQEKEFSPEELERLFLSVDWESGRYPEKLARALANYTCVWSAREDGRLVGLIAALDDGVMTAYIHYVLVDPAAQGKGIGRELTRRVLEVYQEYLRVFLVADRAELAGFYGPFGFRLNDVKKPMYLERF